MQLIQVQDKKTAQDFIRVNVELMQSVPGYIRPLDNDVNNVFDPEHNKAFRNGDCVRWVLISAEGKLLGRIAAFVNKRYKTKGDTVPVGGCGFFDCIDDGNAAKMLFDAARRWLEEKGMTAMDGPINFGERDNWWGLVTKGFHEPLYCMNFNPPYYQGLFEGYGFREFFHQLCFGMDPQQPFPQKFIDRHARVASDPAFSARHIELDKIDQYAADFIEVYNKAWAGHGGMKQMRPEQGRQLFRQMKPVIDKRIIWFAYYQNQPVAMFINLPDLNQWFRFLNGQFGLLQKLKFVWIKKTKPNKKFTGIVFGVVPEWQGKGVDSYLIEEARVMVNKTAYTEYEMQWIGDFNPKMVNVVKSMGDVFENRVLTTYRLLFDPAAEFKRHPVF